MALSRDAILKADDRKVETVEVPEWGGSVLVSVMSGTARDAFEASLVEGGKANVTNARAKLLAACLVDEKGALLFGPDDIEALGRKSATALDRVVRVAQKLNRLTEADLGAAEKN